MKRVLIGLAALSLATGARAAMVWGSVNLNTDGASVSGGFGVLPLPFVGTLGLEGSLQRPYDQTPLLLSVGATLRDINLPATGTDAFLGAGLVFTNPVQPYLEGGLRAPLIGPLGLKIAVRALSSGNVRAGLGAELRF